MELVPLGPGFGVEVKGVSILDVATDAEAYKAVRAAFEEHSLLVFHDQPIADDIQVAYSRAFGPLELTKVSSLGQNTFYSRLTNTMNGKVVPPDHRQVLIAQANALWHTDSSFKRVPAYCSMLHARSIPPIGAQTEFADARELAVWQAGVRTPFGALADVRPYYSAPFFVIPSLVLPMVSCGCADQRRRSLRHAANARRVSSVPSRYCIATSTLTGATFVGTSFTK